MLALVLRQEVLEVLVNSVQEGVDFLERGLSQVLNRSDTVVNHVCKFLTLVSILLGNQVQLIQQNLADLDQLSV